MIRHLKKLSILLPFVLLTLLGPVVSHADLVYSDGVMRYYDMYGREAKELGIDVSFYNNQIDWYALKQQGIDFAVIRLGGRGWGGGVLYDDRQTQIFLREAKQAGIRVGAYFYSTARNPTEALEEAVYAVTILNGETLDLPIFLDMEFSGDYPEGRSDLLNATARADIIEMFCRAVDAAGYRAGYYVSEAFYRYNLDADAVSYLPLWLASYTVDNMLPYYVTDFELWQMTDSVRMGGMDGQTDFNVILPPF